MEIKINKVWLFSGKPSYPTSEKPSYPTSEKPSDPTSEKPSPDIFMLGWF